MKLELKIENPMNFIFFLHLVASTHVTIALYHIDIITNEDILLEIAYQ